VRWFFTQAFLPFCSLMNWSTLFGPSEKMGSEFLHYLSSGILFRCFSQAKNLDFNVSTSHLIKFFLSFSSRLLDENNSVQLSEFSL
jgi:hypothetical protein